MISSARIEPDTGVVLQRRPSRVRLIHRLWTAGLLVALVQLCACSLYHDTTLFDFAKEQAASVQQEDTLYIRFGTATGRSYLGNGWSIDEKDNYGRTFVWATSPHADLRIGAIEPQDLFLVFSGRSLEGSTLKQTAQVSINGQPAGLPFELNPNFNDYRVFVPSRILHAGDNVVGLEFAGTETPPGDARTLAACFDSLRVIPYELQERELKLVRAEEPRYLDELKANGRGMIVQRVPGRRIFSLKVPEGARLSFQCGFAPEDWDMVEGGEFCVRVQAGASAPEVLFKQFIDPRRRHSHRKIFDASLDLAKWGGQEVRIIFSVAAGFDRVAYPTYAIWIDPKVFHRRYIWSR